MGPRTRALCSVLAGLLLGGCPSSPKAVVYDLAARTLAAERWSEAQVLLLGTPGVEPSLIHGFHREARIDGEPFQWAKGEAELALQLEGVQPRGAVVDLAPYEGVGEQRVELFLNDSPVAAFDLADVRSRYHFSLPEDAQRPGDNRLRFVFAQASSPAEADPTSRDRRELAARLYSLTVGPDGDRLQDLLRRDAPRPFEVAEVEGVPSLHLVGPAAVRYALRLPRAAELRFTPELPLAARASAGAASFRVTFESEDDPGHRKGIRGTPSSSPLGDHSPQLDH